MLPPSSEPPTQASAERFDFTFTVEFDADGAAVMRLAGEIDHGNAWQLAAAIESLVMSGATHIHLDTHGLQFADSSFINATEPWALALDKVGGELEISEPGLAVGRLLLVLDILAPTWAHMTPVGDQR